MNILSDADKELIECAENIISKRFDHRKSIHTVGAAIKSKDGKVYTGVNLHSNHGYCAEAIALGSAITAGETEFETIVAIDYTGEILPPCGMCRQLLYEYAPECEVIINDQGKCIKVKLSEMLPFPYVRKNPLSKLRKWLLNK